MRRDDQWLDWGGNGRVVHFAHANGFPPLSYREFLAPLQKDLNVVSYEARPLQPGADPAEINGWEDLADDLVAAMKARGRRHIFGIGHSLGGVISLMAAVRDPGLFSALVLLDPVIFTGARSLVWGLMKATGNSHKMPLFDGAVKRRDHWPDREVIAESWSGRPIFSSWSASSLQAYIEHGTQEDPINGVRLRYPKMWEARIFQLTPHHLWHELRAIDIPVFVLRGQFSDTYSSAAHRRVGRTVRNVKCREILGAGHMFPMEEAGETARLVGEFLAGQ